MAHTRSSAAEEVMARHIEDHCCTRHRTDIAAGPLDSRTCLIGIAAVAVPVVCGQRRPADRRESGHTAQQLVKSYLASLRAFLLISLRLSDSE